ncbi:MAG: DNA replication/repair protein RecF [Clostridia bacterium]
MYIEKLYLQNFLTYEKQFATPSSGLNVIVGQNGSGKTNFVESIFYASLAKSMRGLRDKDLIRWDSKGGTRIKIQIKKEYSTHTIDIYIDEYGKKRIMIDSLPISKIGELIGILNIVSFSPDELGLVKDSPIDRRRFLDISLSQQNRLYFYNLLKYNKLLEQRNKVLKTQKHSPKFKEFLDLITDSMLDCQEYILIERKKFLECLTPLACEEHKILSGGKEVLELNYNTENIDYDNIKESLKLMYKKAYEKDCKLEYTTVGIHRDDIKIIVNDIDIRKFGSQGQQRTAVLSLKFAEMQTFYQKTGEYPVLILDDVLSELDQERKNALFERTKNIQTFLTCTEFVDGSDKSYKKLFIKDKCIKEIEDIK